MSIFTSILMYFVNYKNEKNHKCHKIRSLLIISEGVITFTLLLIPRVQFAQNNTIKVDPISNHLLRKIKIMEYE